MNTNMEDFVTRVKRYNTVYASINHILDQLSPEVDIRVYSDCAYIDAHTRSDLQLLMAALGDGLWNKEPACGPYLRYRNGNTVIYAHEGAMPPTCRVVKKQVTLPPEPAKPERVVETEEVVCDVTSNETAPD